MFKKLVVLFSCILSTNVMAWQPSDRNITVYIPFAPGSVNDLSFRAIAPVIEQEKNVQFLIQNIPGADGNIAVNQFIKHPADGQTIAVVSIFNTFVDAKIRWNNVIQYNPSELTLVTNLAHSPLAFIVKNNSSVTDLDGLIREVKLNRRPLNFAIASFPQRVSYEYMLKELGVKNSQSALINYKSPLLAAQDVAGGHAEFGIVSLAVAQRIEASGKIKIIGITSRHIIPLYSHIPLVSSRISGLNINASVGIVLPPNTNIEIQRWYSDAVISAINSESVRRTYQDNQLFIKESDLGPVVMKQDITDLTRKWSTFISTIDKSQ